MHIIQCIEYNAYNTIHKIQLHWKTMMHACLPACTSVPVQTALMRILYDLCRTGLLRQLALASDD